MKSLCKIVDLSKVSLKDIDKAFVREFRNKLLASKLSQNTASVYFQWFTSFLTLAVEHEYMETNPCIGVPTISMDDAVHINYVLHEDILKLKNAECPNPDQKRACLFSSQTGMRSGDMKQLTWKRITTVGELYRIVLKQEKTDKPYIIHFRQDVMDLLGEPGEPDDLVFPKFKNNTLCNPHMVIWFFNAKVTPRGIPEQTFTPHDFRHTFAITLGLNGANLYEISQMLGHSAVSTTERHYARILEQMKQKIVLNLPSLNEAIQEEK
jgi:integrase/recombinase XerD